MAKHSNAKPIIEPSAKNMSRREIARARHISAHTEARPGTEIETKLSTVTGTRTYLAFVSQPLPDNGLLILM